MTAPRTESVRVDALAKVTLSLAVLGARPDGYHELEALAVSVTEPADHLVLRLRSEPGVGCTVTGPHAAGVPDDATNLAVRAVTDALGASASPPAGCAIEIHKNIGPGAGLGGGSSDAAAALRGAQALFGAGLDDRTVHELGSAIGSDVPFCLGTSPAWMRGRGEIIEPITAPLDLAVVIAIAPFPCSTPEVFRAWDALDGPRGRRRVPMPAAGAFLGVDLANDLEPAAEHVYPALAAFRATVTEAAGREPVLAGSGSSYALIGADQRDARAMQDRLQAAGIEAHRGTVASAGVVVRPPM